MFTIYLWLPKQDIIKPLLEIKERFERRLDRDFNKNVNDNFNLSYSRLRGGFETQKNKQSWIRFVYQNYRDETSPRVGPNVITARSDLYEGFWQDKSTDGLGWKLGRQEVVKGEKRLLGDNNWGQGQSWDGLRLAWRRLDAFAGQNGFRSRPNSQAKISYLSYLGSLGETTLIYKQDTAPIDSDRVWTVDQLWTQKSGRWDYMLEGVAQSGRSTAKDLGAWAAIGRARYAMNKKLSVAGEFDIASGGSSAKHTSLLDPLYPSTHGLYGQMDMQGLRNLKSLALNATYKATADIDLKLDLRKFFLFDKTDGWYGTSGTINKRVGGSFVDPTGAKGDNVGDEIDLTGVWRINKQQELQLGAAVFQPGSFIKSFYAGGAATNQYWFYASYQFKM